MKRRLFALASALSMLLLVATAGLWACGNLPKDGWPKVRASRFGFVGAATFDGRLLLFDVTDACQSSLLYQVPQRYMAETGGAWRSAGFNFNAGGSPTFERHLVLIVPLWSLCAVFFLSAGLFEGAARRGKNHSGRCAACDYDLRATPERCPECGSVPAKSAEEMR